MGHFHDLLVVPRAELAAAVEDTAHTSRQHSAHDVGITTDNIANIISVLRGVDIDDCLEELLDEIEAETIESSSDDDTYGTALSDTIRDELADTADSATILILPKWLALEGKYGMSGFDPAESLRRLINQCRIAKRENHSVVIKSYE